MIKKRKKKFPSEITRPYVFVPMTLDFLHIGHVKILNHAKKYGSIILGLVTDKGIGTYKGKKTINNYSRRKKFAQMLNDIEYTIPVRLLKDIPLIFKKYN